MWLKKIFFWRFEGLDASWISTSSELP
jgi:hypothetical protein